MKELVKIFFKGQAGQGIKLLSHSLAKILIQFNFEVSVYVNYGASVSSGNVFSELIFSKKKVEIPFVETPDIEVLFEKGGEDKVTIKNNMKPSTESLNVGRLAVEKINNKRSENMIILGRLIKILELDVKKVKFKEILPEKFYDDNLKAIQLGCEVKD